MVQAVPVHSHEGGVLMLKYLRTWHLMVLFLGIIAVGAIVGQT